MDNYILFLFCIVGLCFGSFFNVVILRSLSGESIVFPGSKCPKCNHKLYPWHNIPVLSYILLRGKCYFCKEKISIQYPIVELVTMFAFAASYLKFGLSIDSIFGIILLSGLIIMTTTDLKEKLVDCNIAILLAVCGLVFSYLRVESITDSLLGLILGAVIIEAVARLGYFIKPKIRVMGEADTYVAGALGAFFGVNGICIVLVYSLIASVLFALPAFLFNQYKNNNKSTCILFVIFALSAVIFKAAYQNWITFAAVGISGLLLSVSILKNIKNETKRTYLPFVPALAAATIFYIFFQ